MVLALLVVALVLAVLVVRARWAKGRASGRLLRRPRRELRLPGLPAADQPPAGLPPLVDSPRVLARDCRRGLRELEQWLADQTCT